MLVYYSDYFLKHSMGHGHPECPERLEVIKKELEKNKEIKFLEPKPITDEDLYLVHEKRYIAKLKQLSEKGASYSDDSVVSEDSHPDNVFSKETFAIASLAASAAKEAALSCDKEFSFALVRPPGHHAGKSSFAGFCYINNIAFAVRSLQAKNKGKGMIIDIDYHHGNGTQDIFYNDESVFYFSLHSDPRTAYPGTGFKSENNKHVRNVPLPKNISDEEYLKEFEKELDDSFKSFEPDFIGVSAGFDTYNADPIAGLGIQNINTYKLIGEKISSFKLPTFIILEGGYYLPKLGEMVKTFFSGFQKI